MEFASSHRYTQNPSLNFPENYCRNRNAPLTFSNGARPNPRGCPMGGPLAGPTLRAGMGREENLENGQARRRIAVACARCRKRKIKCSGDPGDGTGCKNCRTAGIDINACQFHRVGSDSASRVLDIIHHASSLTGMASANSIIPAYNTASGVYFPRSNTYPQVDTKTAYPPAWAFPFAEETSPVEMFNMDQPTTFIPNHGTAVAWNHTSGKTFLGNVNYADQETVSMPVTHGHPYTQTANLKPTTTEALSPLNMTSLQMTLPERPHPRLMQSSEVPQRQLPIPLPSPAQATRNVVDQLQDQRLRSSQAMGSASLPANGFSKQLLPFSSDSDIQLIARTEAPTTGLATEVITSGSTSSATDSTIAYLPIATTLVEDTNTKPKTSINFSTSSLLGDLPAPTLPTASYSNFRNYKLPTSSAETISPLARQNSYTNSYSFTPDGISKPRSACDAVNHTPLVSGHRYTPLNRSQSQNQPVLDGGVHGNFGTRSVPVHRASMSYLNRSF